MKYHRIVFNEYDGTAEIYANNRKLKKRITAYAATRPNLFKLSDDQTCSFRFDID